MKQPWEELGISEQEYHDYEEDMRRMMAEDPGPTEEDMRAMYEEHLRDELARVGGEEGLSPSELAERARDNGDAYGAPYREAADAWVRGSLGEADDLRNTSRDLMEADNRLFQQEAGGYGRAMGAYAEARLSGEYFEGERLEEREKRIEDEHQGKVQAVFSSVYDANAAIGGSSVSQPVADELDRRGYQEYAAVRHRGE